MHSTSLDRLFLGEVRGIGMTTSVFCCSNPLELPLPILHQSKYGRGLMLPLSCYHSNLTFAALRRSSASPATSAPLLLFTARTMHTLLLRPAKTCSVSLRFEYSACGAAESALPCRCFSQLLDRALAKKTTAAVLTTHAGVGCLVLHCAVLGSASTMAA